MTRVVATVPAETDLLCERCGYVLNGLGGPNARCPECGTPLEESAPEKREPPAWEREGGRLRGLLRTTRAVLLSPTRFYRTLATRQPVRAAARFAWIHWALTALLLSIAATTHAIWYSRFASSGRLLVTINPAGVLLAWVITFALLVLTARLTGWLTAWEAAYRGLRLPYATVLRGLYYHAPHYLPVALVAAATVVTYRELVNRGMVGPGAVTTYLYVLCAEVILAAIYLFKTYWIAMRNMMYANR